MRALNAFAVLVRCDRGKFPFGAGQIPVFESREFANIRVYFQQLPGRPNGRMILILLQFPFKWQENGKNRLGKRETERLGFGRARREKKPDFWIP